MLPFVRRQLDVGEFVYDASLPAMRATIYGLESGAIDLLITQTETYQLSGPHDDPDGCVALGRKFNVPAAQWLTSKAVCEGEAPVQATPVEWWKMPGSEDRAQRQWYRTDTRLPWRTMYPSPSPEPAVIGEYGMTYFPTFAPLAETNLARLRNFCAANAHKVTGAAATASTARELMAAGPDIADAERAERIQALIPGLSRQACTAMTMPRWPDQFVMTGILSSIPAKWTPLPSLIFYDWKGAATLFAYMHEARSVPPVIELVSVLTPGVGYAMERLPNGAFACAARSPGVVRPDWMTWAGCECQGVIDHNPDLGPQEVSQIRACPVKNQDLRVNWAWYTAQGRPILFMEPGAVGNGINVADYEQWLPGVTMAKEAFEVPQLCTHAEEAGLPPVGHGLPAETTVSCSACHTTQQ
jgi:hypothetical protein